MTFQNTSLMISITQLFIFTVRLLFQFGILVSEEKKTPVKIFDQSVINNIVKNKFDSFFCVTSGYLFRYLFRHNIYLVESLLQFIILQLVITNIATLE